MGYGESNGVGVIVNVGESPNKQVDFVKLLQEHNEVAPKLYARVVGDHNIEVIIPFKGKKAAHFAFYRPPITNEEYMIMQEGYVSTLVSPSQTVKKNYDSRTGTWTDVAPNAYTTQVNATFTTTFTGTGYDFQHYADNRGGIWEFVVDGDTAGKITISTFSSATIQQKVETMHRGLSSGSHTVVATFKGDDPLNVPSGGAGTSRGWIKYNNGTGAGKETILVFEDVLGPVKAFDVIANNSNKEFAIPIKPFELSASSTAFIPGHTTVATTTAISQKIYFDETEITTWTPDVYLREVKSVKIVQKMSAKHPDDVANPMAEIYSIHTVSAKGVSVKVKIKYLRKLSSGSGYAMMFPIYNTFAKQLITSYENRYDTLLIDGSSTDLTAESDKAISYAYLNTGGTNGEPDIVAALTIQNVEKTFRYGKSGRRTPLVWLQHRNDGIIHKLYTQAYESATIESGDTHEIGGTFFIGELPMASDVLS